MDNINKSIYQDVHYIFGTSVGDDDDIKQIDQED